MSQKSSLKKLALFNLIGKTIELLIKMLIPIFLVRVFNQEQYGLYRQALMISLTASTILGFSFTHSLYYFYPIAKSDEERSGILAQTFYILVLIGSGVVVIALVLKHYISGLINENIDTIYICITFHVAFTIIYGPLTNLFILEGSAPRILLYNILSPIVRVALLISFVLMFHSTESALWALVIYTIINTVFLFTYLISRYRISFSSINLNNIIRQLKYVYPMALSGIAGTIGNQADKLILIALFSAKDYAIYSIGNFQIPFVALIYTSIGNVILTKISKYSTDGIFKEESLLLWKKMVVKNAVVTIPLVCFTILLANSIITLLFGDQYEQSANVFRIIVLILFVQMLGFGYVLRGYGETKHILKANIVKMVISIVLGVFLIKLLGLLGAALSYVLAFTANALIQLIRTKKILNINCKDLLPWNAFFQILKISLVPIPLILFLFLIDLPKLLLIALSGLVFFPIVMVLLMKYNYFSLISVKNIIQSLISNN